MADSKSSSTLAIGLFGVFVLIMSGGAWLAPNDPGDEPSLASQMVRSAESAAESILTELHLSPEASAEALRGSNNQNSPSDNSAENSLEELRPKPGEHPLDPVLRLARDSLVKLQAEVQDYTATMLKRERISGKLSPENVMEIKVLPPRKLPDGGDRTLHVYMKFTAPKSAAGREVIWIEGENQGNIIAHEGGFMNLMRVNLPPTGTLAMMGNRYPISDVGLDNLIDKLIERGERDKKLGDCIVNIIDNQMIGDRRCRLIEVVHPTKESQWEFYKAQIYFDSQEQLPLRYAAYLWPEKAGGEPILEEEYTYTNLKLNVGLTREDFDPDNPKYNYP